MTAPTHGAVLDAESVKLEPGDLVRQLDWDAVTTVDDVSNQGAHVGVSLDGKYGVWPASRFTFLGRPDADGWIEWHGGENPVPGQRVDWKSRIGETGINEASESCAWWHGSPLPGGDIIAYRLARPTPCETCNGHGMIGGPVGQTPESLDWVTEDCPDCTPPAQPEPGAQLIGAEKYEAWRASELARKQAEYDRDTLGAGELEVVQVRATLFAALEDYKLTNMCEEGDDTCGYPLVDLMSNDGATIDTGREEMRILADNLAEAIEKTHFTQAQAKIARLEEQLEFAKQSIEQYATWHSDAEADAAKVREDLTALLDKHHRRIEDDALDAARALAGQTGKEA